MMSPPQESAKGAAAPVDSPLRGASLPEALRRFFAKYATFSGRASRSEYWWWVLVPAALGLSVSSLSRADSRRGRCPRDDSAAPEPCRRAVRPLGARPVATVRSLRLLSH